MFKKLINQSTITVQNWVKIGLKLTKNRPKRTKIYYVHKVLNFDFFSGYINEGGGLTYAIIRNAGHMVPISQPLWALELVTQFTHNPPSKRWEKPAQLKVPRLGAKFYNCP